jgi:CubicO group peptidase (beta-lactamase class C family)
MTYPRSAAALAAILTVASAAPAQQVSAPPPTTYTRALAAGYKALTLCSTMFTAGRRRADVEALELKGIYPSLDPIVPTLSASVDERAHIVSVPFDAPGGLPPRVAAWQAAKGCTLRPIGGTSPSASTAAKTGPASADPRAWPLGDGDIAPRPSATLSAKVAAAFNRSTYGAGNETVSVVIVRDGRIVAERYRDGFTPFTANRTWSVAKSMSGTLAGMAGLQPQAPAAIANWRVAGDPRGAITNDQLMRMASGLHSDTAGNRADAIYFGGTAVDEEAPAWSLDAKPGTRFRYANNDILLAVLSMRQRLGDRRYDAWPQAALFGPLGMTHTVAEQDWRGNYILSSQVWSTARDFARLGQFWLQDGVWQGKRLLPGGWIRYMTTPSGPQPEGDGPGYGATMWLFGPRQGLPAGSYAAQGNRGQYIMVVPSARLVVVRRGEDGGAARFDIARFTADVLAARP